MELPAEIRLAIYEELASLHIATDFRLVMGLRIPEFKSRTGMSCAITRVNRQIRTESIPILYRNVEVRMFTGIESDRHQATRWVAEFADKDLLAAVKRYSFLPLVGRHCRMNVIAAPRHRWWLRISHQDCPDGCASRHESISEYRDRADIRLGRLGMYNEDPPTMTRERLASLLRVCCL